MSWSEHYKCDAFLFQYQMISCCVLQHWGHGKTTRTVHNFCQAVWSTGFAEMWKKPKTPGCWLVGFFLMWEPWKQISLRGMEREGDCLKDRDWQLHVKLELWTPLGAWWVFHSTVLPLQVPGPFLCEITQLRSTSACSGGACALTAAAC